MIRLLVVDDDPVNRHILTEYLADEGYELVEAADGEEAWTYLQDSGTSFYAVLLDRMMPKMDGLTLLARMQEESHLRHVPVIMQTAAGAAYQIQEGIEAGAFYYLTKPYERDMLLAIVAAAVRKGVQYYAIQEDLKCQALSVQYMDFGRFRVRTLQDVSNLVTLLAHACPNPERAAMGLTDLLVNAVEHGNLSISYDEKSVLQDNGNWEAEVTRRLNLPENFGKRVDVTFERFEDDIHIRIRDEGEGFDWQAYQNIGPDDIWASHGRGIAMAKALSFDRLEYEGCGNQVLCVVHTRPDEPEAVHESETIDQRRTSTGEDG